MADPNNQEINKDNPAGNAALEALGNAARAFASLNPNVTAGFPPLGVDASAFLMNPAAAVAAVAAAAAAQSQANPAAATVTAPPPAIPPPATLPPPFAIPQPTVTVTHPPTTPAPPTPAPTLPNPAATLAAVAGGIPAQQALQGMTAFFQAMGQATQAQSLAAAATAAAAAANPPPPPPVSYSHSPTPPTAFPQQRAVPEPAAPAAAAATVTSNQNTFQHVVAAQAAQQAHAAAAASTPAIPNSALSHIQSWSLEQLEGHVKLLQQMKQPVPQSVALLLADARRKEEKKTAKRVANRKSACTSRARKKALVEEMTRTNARLRRQALILSLLPDLVIVISQEGEITFCSAQVERVLRHKIDDLVGSDIRSVLIPASRTALGKLIQELTNPNEKGNGGAANEARSRRAARGDGGQQGSAPRRRENKARDDENGNVSGASSGSGGVSSGAAAVVSDQSFPLSVVKVDSKQEPPSDENDNSDASGGGGKEPVISSLSNSTARSPSASLANSGSGSEDGARGASAAPKEDGDSKNGERLSPSAAEGKPSSDDSSSGSTETKNIRKANENLERNVRWHNKKLQQSLSKSAKAKPGHKDDVLGDSVTPNNALARLSSLQHYPETAKSSKKRKQFDSIGDRSSSEDSLLEKKNANNENASDDSGYRESNDSREETSSSASESSNSNGRNKPLAPTCNVCLIREDLTTLWCEVTSSIRTRSVEDETSDESLSTTGGGNIKNVKVAAASKSAGSKASKTSTASEETPLEHKPPETKELLLCLRPIRDGDGKVDESLRFVPRSRMRIDASCSPVPSTGLPPGSVTAPRAVSNASGGDLSDPNPDVNNTGDDAACDRKRPPKKRTLPLQSSAQRQQGAMEGEIGASPKRMRVKGGPSTSSTDTEKSVVESLMLMSHKSN